MQDLKFPNVTAVAKANVYFDGKVISHTLHTSEGGRMTLGLVYPGEYHFDTAAAEVVDITAGRCRIKLDGQGRVEHYDAGSRFEVPARSGFSISVESGITEYVCTFV